ncbi:hypothetical protein BDZ94DRAFT_886431 [Collybia nuda]|uniref:Uncharacterized protein n=1 Tax=Collybia nuda TaxID=64659 RepID=A0A9P5Y1W5_9AGAR|nr:hypothetical protein BDZ94DRAFT_886431 [Collybia nuda]
MCLARGYWSLLVTKMPGTDLAQELRRLEDFVAKVQHESNSDTVKQDHRDIYSFIEEKVLSPKSELVNEVPPLWLVIYTIDSILRPTLAQDQIPDLLDLLATAEFYRGRSLDKARDAVTWSDYYQRPERRKEGRPLTSSQRIELLSLEENKHLWRKVYLTLVRRFCHLDLYFLWTAKSPSITDFFVRFNEYFPFLTSSRSGSPRLFYKGLSYEERLELGETATECCNFAQNTVQWALDQQRDSTLPMNELFHTQEFRETFPLPDDLESISEDTQKYLNWTQLSMRIVMKAFQDDI